MLSRVQVSVPQSTFSPTRPRAVLVAPIAARLHHGASRCVTAVPVRSAERVSKCVPAVAHLPHLLASNLLCQRLNMNKTRPHLWK